jgi:hypothetical protein
MPLDHTVIEVGCSIRGDHDGGAASVNASTKPAPDRPGTGGNHRDLSLEVLHGTDVWPTVLGTYRLL